MTDTLIQDMMAFFMLHNGGHSLRNPKDETLWCVQGKEINLTKLSELMRRGDKYEITSDFVTLSMKKVSQGEIRVNKPDLEIFVPEGYVLVSLDSDNKMLSAEERKALYVSNTDWESATEIYSPIGGVGRMVPIICHKPIATKREVGKQDPEHDLDGNELQECESCPAKMPIEQMISTEDSGWFCPGCLEAARKDWQAKGGIGSIDNEIEDGSANA